MQLANGALTRRREVGAFYERHPYPPPRDHLAALAQSWGDDERRAQSHLLWPSEPYRDDRSILVAGCGTTQAARLASRWPRSEVVGIDISATSLEFTERLKVKHGLENLQVRELAVEDARELGRAFDHVVCTGVLHHLPDPPAGLAALHDVLEPTGALNLLVYAPYGRAGVYLLQDYCRRLGISPTSGDLRALAATLLALPDGHPLSPLLRNTPDFRTEAGLADALLHPQDRSYSAPEVFALLDQCGLRFGRWLRQAPYLPQCGAPATTPHCQLLMNLPSAERYAAMELFRGAMVRHNLLAYRDDAPAAPTPESWDEADWARVTPVSLGDTVIVRDRLPAGASAVLINRAHTDTDLVLPLTAEALDLFHAIDGITTARQLAGRRQDMASSFETLRRLWEYDHIVFDSSAFA